ncbi:MAG TPA: hypothetical protein VFY16_00100 [Gemmatimonadaceae bacterium]|nr:hypothetical protein [Gemmatimonadaceae bacterium]
MIAARRLATALAVHAGAILFVLAPLAAGAQEHRHGADSARPRLYDNLGTLHKPITTTAPLAQRYFDQGLRLTYAFNHEEAIHAYQEALRHDPECAMCWWGIAYALGPNINLPMDTAAERRAYAAAREARRREARVTPAERAYIAALALRYDATPGARRAAHDSAYAAAMRVLATTYPDDPDASTLYAEAMLDLRPWDQWKSDGTPQPGTEAVVATLERVLARDSLHPGACHFYIHAVENSRTPERALPCAERLPSLMPGAGHLVHMPAHTYIRTGRYLDAIRANQHAAHEDEMFLRDRTPRGIYPFYYAHNLHFLWAAASMAGQSAVALQAARDVAAKAPYEMARQIPFAEFLVPTPYFALARFERWDDLLREPTPPADLRYTRGMWHYAHGRAAARTGRLPEARRDLDSLTTIAGAMPADRIVGQNPAKALLEIAVHGLAADVSAASGDTAAAVRHFEAAVPLEDALRYDEPPNWPLPIRQSLGELLLASGRPADAERAFEKDLARNVENGWALSGLTRALRAQGRSAEADAAEARLRKAWAEADVKVVGR